jgi:PAS domain S-box-containing protein
MTFQNLLIKNCSKFQGKYIMKRIRYGVDDVEEPHLVKVLEERVKELNCLYGISKSLSSYDKSLDDILNEVVNLIPPAFQYPELTCVRILLNGQEFKTNQFQRTLWKISSELSTPDGKIGVLEVYYLKKVPEEFESPFIKEEQDLINAISIELIRFLRRKKAETLLKESEDNLRLILTSAAEAIYGLDVDGNCTFCNPACIRLLGYEEPEELLGTNIHNLVHTSQEQISPDIESCPVKKSYKTGKHVHVDDVVFWRKDGSTFNAECWSYPTIKDGEIVGAVVTFIDITQRLDIEKDRDRLFNFSIDMMCIAGFDGYFKKLNPAWEKTLGWTTTELTSKPYQEFMHPDDRERTARLIKSLKKGDNILKFDNRYLCNDGSYKWLSWNAYILSEEELVFGVARDATELKENEEALKESEKKYRKIFENVQDVFYQTDLEGKITEISPSIERYSKFKPSELIGNPVELVYLDPEDREFLLNAIQDKGEVADYEVTLVNKDKTQFFVSVNAHYLLNSQNQPIGVEGSLRDITDRKKMELELRKSLEEKEMLVKEIHHRVKNNLMVISSLLNLQSRYIKDKKALSMFKESQNRAKSMALIHERLYRSTDLKSIDFGDYLRTLATDLYRTYVPEPSRIELDMNVEKVMIDINTAIPLGLIVNELLSNSMKHAFPGKREGEINLEFGITDDEFVLVVGDNGIGFPEDLEFQNTSSLGLQLVNTLTRQISGIIELDTTNGTLFSIKFKEMEY